MKFLVQNVPLSQHFTLVYQEEDYGFDVVEPLSGWGFTSIMINDLQLEIDDNGLIDHVWGYCPLIHFQVTDKRPEDYESHPLVVQLDQTPIPGIGIRLNQNAPWPIYINKPKGWVCLGNPNSKGDQMVEFAYNCVAVLENQEMIALWLRPERLPKFSQ